MDETEFHKRSALTRKGQPTLARPELKKTCVTCKSFSMRDQIKTPQGWQDDRDPEAVLGSSGFCTVYRELVRTKPIEISTGTIACSKYQEAEA